MIDSPPETPLRPALHYTAGWTIFALITFVAVSVVAQPLNLGWGLWFSELTVFAGLAVVGYQVIGFAPLQAMGLQRFDARAFGVGFAFGAVNLFAWATPLMAGAKAIFPAEMVEKYDSARVFAQPTLLEVAIVLLGVSLAAPLGEELLFRGFLQRGLEVRRGGPRAIVVTALVFSLFHFNPVALTSLFELGVLFGLLAWRAGSVWPAIGAHAASNLISSLMFLSAPEHAKDLDTDWRVVGAMFVVGNAALLALIRWAWSRLPVGQPMAWVVAPAKSPAQLFAPWVLGGCVAIGLLLAIDLRGVQLNLLELRVQVKRPLRSRADVKELRARVRRGEAEVREYEEKIRSVQ